MPKKGPSELKAGIFVLVAMAILLGVVLWLGGAKLFEPAEGIAWLYAETTAGPQGLGVDFDVVINDVTVGRIARVDFRPKEQRTYYVVELTDGRVKLHTDAEVVVSSGVLGGSKLAIKSMGTEDKPLADSETRAIPLSGGFAQALNELAETVDQELDKSDPESLISKIRDMMSQLRAASSDIAAITQNLRPEMNPRKSDSMLASFKTTADNLAHTTGTIDRYAQEDLGEIIVKIREISNVVLRTANNLDVTSEKIKTFMVANSDVLDETMSNMLAVSANLKAASTEIRRNPWRLLYQPDKQEMRSVNLYDAARAFHDAANQLDTAVTKLSALQKMEADDPAAEEQVKQIRQRLMESFKKFQKAEQALWKELSVDGNPPAGS